MKWELKEPRYADMIRVKVGNIYHYGIFVSDDEVIQFGFAPGTCPDIKPCDVEVCSSDIERFLCGNFLEVGVPEKKELKKLRVPDDIVNTARSRLGERNYSIIYNNCEHFAYECVLGERFCSQTDNVREIFKKLPIVDVYTAQVSYDAQLSPLYPKEVSKEILQCQDKKLACQKYFEWKLLEYALDRTFGKKIKKLSFERIADGHFKCDDCEFALAHCYDMVAVAVSRATVKISVDSDCADSEYDWSRDTLVNEKAHRICVKTATPEKIRFYQNVSL